MFGDYLFYYDKSKLCSRPHEQLSCPKLKGYLTYDEDFL
jgi:hypothetical protein